MDALKYVIARKEIHRSEIFYLMRHGGGGFTYWDCYSMPIQIRKWNVKRLSKEIKEENDKAKESSKKSSGTGTQFSMDDMIKGKGIEQMKTDYQAPKRKELNQNPKTPSPAVKR